MFTSTAAGRAALVSLDEDGAWMLLTPIFDPPAVVCTKEVMVSFDGVEVTKRDGAWLSLTVMLSKAGIEYARRLAVYAKEKISIQKTTNEDGTTEESVVPIRLWTSTLLRAKETTQFFEHPTIRWKFDNNGEADWIQFRHMIKRNLDELYAGGCDGMTYKEIKMKYPEEFARRQTDKLAYCYSRCESYIDVMLRLEPLAHEMERIREPVLVVGHQGIH
mmetsp:Transcript_30997/g.70917  ORF Transcript_30997/g.70917 Transcript_30997/m.70917 type:complete len:218 (-) Transcript_30997:577-1230(-)